MSENQALTFALNARSTRRSFESLSWASVAASASLAGSGSIRPAVSSVERRATPIFSGLISPTQVRKVFSLPTVPAMVSWKSIFTERKKCLGRFEQWKLLS